MHCRSMPMTVAVPGMRTSALKVKHFWPVAPFDHWRLGVPPPAAGSGETGETQGVGLLHDAPVVLRKVVLGDRRTGLTITSS